MTATENPAYPFRAKQPTPYLQGFAEGSEYEHRRIAAGEYPEIHYRLPWVMDIAKSTEDTWNLWLSRIK